MRYLFAASLLALTILPANAQEMRSPTVKQCHMGYRTSYMHSMHWSRAAFREACAHKMMMMKKHKMMHEDSM